MVKVLANQRHIADLRLILNANRIGQTGSPKHQTYLRISSVRATDTMCDFDDYKSLKSSRHALRIEIFMRDL